MSRPCPKCGKTLPPLDLPVCPHCAARIGRLPEPRRPRAPQPEPSPDPGPSPVDDARSNEPAATEPAAQPADRSQEARVQEALATLEALKAGAVPAERTPTDPLMLLPVTGDETPEELLRRFFQPPVVYRTPPAQVLIQALVAPLPFVATWILHRLDPAAVGPGLLAATGLLSLLILAWLGIVRRPGRDAVILSRGGITASGREVSWSQVIGTRLYEEIGRRQREPQALAIEVSGQPPVRIPREKAATGALRSLRNLGQVIELVVAARGRAEASREDPP